MSKYEKGDKVVMEITGVSKYGECYEVAHTSMWNTIRTERVTEPLSTYTEPLEDIIQKYTVKIARLIMEKEELKDENERLKAENEKMSVKIDAYELCGDQHEEEYNQAFNQGAEAAWELARKMNNYEFYVNVSEFQKKVLEFVNSGELDKFFENTVFDNYEYKNDCKSAMITGMSLASMITSDCELIGIGMEISQDKAGE